MAVEVSGPLQEMYIHDSPGKEVFADYVPEYVSPLTIRSLSHYTHSLQWDNPGLVVVAFDVSKEQTLDSCVKWLERVRAQKPAVETQLPGITGHLYWSVCGVECHVQECW